MTLHEQVEARARALEIEMVDPEQFKWLISMALEMKNPGGLCPSVTIGSGRYVVTRSWFASGDASSDLVLTYVPSGCAITGHARMGAYVHSDDFLRGACDIMMGKVVLAAAKELDVVGPSAE